MRRVETDTKFDESTFFDGDNLDGNEALSFAGSAKMLEKGAGFADEQRPFVSFLRRVCLFLPGTFLLFYMSFGVGIIAMEIIVYRRALEMLPDDYPLQFALMGLIIFLGTLMTWFGLGEIKNRKHFAIPASLMVTGALIGAVVKLTASISGIADRMLDDFSYLIYLLPLALVVPILAKGVVDRKAEDA